jgi:seryl-tRNA synthetase
MGSAPSHPDQRAEVAQLKRERDETAEVAQRLQEEVQQARTERDKALRAEVEHLECERADARAGVQRLQQELEHARTERDEAAREEVAKLRREKAAIEQRMQLDQVLAQQVRPALAPMYSCSLTFVSRGKHIRLQGSYPCRLGEDACERAMALSDSANMMSTVML